jgi:UDP-N-acetylglucosamine--N-acetylmuramyl-(pentapeptide) pyrophosphoryl-undecaprenol N-acetylglucosamine transferase
MPTDPRTLVIAAGGTGGHLFPGVAVADELRRRDPAVRVVFAGTPKGLESRIVPKTGYELELLPILPLNGVGAARALKGLLALPYGLLRSAGLLRRLRPFAVLGIGGYAGGPVTLVAALLGIPTVLLEPNATPGFTNRVLKAFVGRAAVSYEEARTYFGAKGVLTGNPVRGGFAGLPSKVHQEPYTLLVFGGSQGSRVLNTAMVAALPHLPGPDRLRIVHQAGANLHDEVRQGYAAAGREAEVTPFIDDMERRFAEADLVVCRAGATSAAELAAAGKPSVLVPFAKAADDHQRHNALALQNAGASRMVEEKDLSGASLAAAIQDALSSPQRLQAMEQAARGLARPDAAARVADLLEGKA